MVASPTLCGRAFRSGCRYKARQLGAREADLLRDYPALRAEDLQYLGQCAYPPRGDRAADDCA